MVQTAAADGADLALPRPPPPAASGAPAAQLLQELVEHSRSVAQLHEGRLRGPGAAVLRELGGQAQHVVMGEQHGNQGIAEFATAWWADLVELGFTHAGLEADPWVTRRMEQLLRSGGLDAWARHLSKRGGLYAAAFYAWDAEARWVQAVLQSRGKVASLWGLDQVFIGSAGWLLQELADADTGARHAEARSQATRLAAQAQADPQWLGRADPQALASLSTALQDELPPWRQFGAALLASREIYAPHTGGPGESWIANARREDLMRSLFAEQYRTAEAALGRAPRVMLKLGAYHAYRGASPLMVQGLGGFVSEWAAARQQRVLTALVLCGPGSQGARYGGDPVPCDQPLREGDWRFLAPYVAADGLTVFDLRSWRLRQRRLAGLPHEVQSAVASFDLLVIAPRSPGSQLIRSASQAPR